MKQAQNQALKTENQGQAASIAPIANEDLDDRGTDQSEASEILQRLRDEAFDSSDEKLALALGRPKDEISEWIKGSGTIDGDVLLKARALAKERGVEIA